ncbi:hypothetical protein JCM10213_008697 [Rhodosporidiobolus nylandii]
MAAPTNSDHLEAYKAQALKEFQAAQSYLNDKRQEVQSLYLAPAVAMFGAAAEKHPLATTLLTVFAALSFLPVATFLLFAIGSLLVVGGGALIGATVLLAWLVGSAALLLVGALAVTGFLSLLATVSLLGTYAVYRFFAILRQADTFPEAVKDFQLEASNLYGSGQQVQDGVSNGGSKKVRIDGVVKQEGEGDTTVKLDGAS